MVTTTHSLRLSVRILILFLGWMTYSLSLLRLCTSPLNISDVPSALVFIRPFFGQAPPSPSHLNVFGLFSILSIQVYKISVWNQGAQGNFWANLL